MHTLELTLRNRTPDSDIKESSLIEERIVITQDSEFVDSFVLKGMPYKLLLISTGNIKNADWELLFSQNFDWLVKAFEHHGFIEIDKTMVTIHV